ncbi:MAG: DUF5615 family PIN-like protein [Candidatus Dormibacteraceae bacterium]
MRALLDEQLSPRIALLLREAGFDVVAVADRDDLRGRSDRIVLEVASREDRAVVRSNVKHFRPIASEWLAEGRTQAGLILLPWSRVRGRAATSALARAIGHVLRDNPGRLEGSERWIGPLE